MNHKSVLTTALVGLLLSLAPCYQVKADNDFFKILRRGADAVAGLCSFAWISTLSKSAKTLATAIHQF